MSAASARRRTLARAMAAALLAAAAAPSAAQPPLSADPGVKAGALDPHRPLAQELQTSSGDDLVVTAVGGLAIAGAEGSSPAFDPAVVALLRGADRPALSHVAVADLETTLFDPRLFQGYPQGWGEASTPSAAPSMAAALKAAGFDLVARANPHALDWGIEGMRATDEALDDAGLIHAGTGLTAGQARSPRYYDDPQGRGRIALVSAATTFRPTSEALQAEGAAPGRPGVAGVHVDPVRLVSPAELVRLQQIDCAFRHPGRTGDCPTAAATSVTVLGATFEAAAPALQHTTDNRLDRPQAQEMLRFVREGRQNADYLVVALHAEQVDDARPARSRAPRFLEELAHAAVDGGADLVMVTGRPALGPIEIYRATGRPPRPIFYGLGDFYRSPGAAAPDADPAANWSVLARTSVAGRRLRVDLYPIDLSAGSPRLADGPLARTILKRLSDLSAPYGVGVEIEAANGTYRGRILDDGRSRDGAP